VRRQVPPVPLAGEGPRLVGPLVGDWRTGGEMPGC